MTDGTASLIHSDALDAAEHYGSPWASPWHFPRFTVSGTTDERIRLSSEDKLTETDPSTEALPPALEDNWIALALSGLSERAYERIQILARKPEGWRGSSSKPLRSDSLGDFLTFWNIVRPYAKEPEFALTPRGHIQAEWHKSWKRHLELEFVGNGRVFYGLFDKNSVHEGVGGLEELCGILQSRGSKPLRWTAS